MKAMTGYYCTGSPDARTRCGGYCKGCGYGRFDAYGLHKNEDYDVPSREKNPTYIPSHYRPFVSDSDLRSGRVELY